MNSMDFDPGFSEDLSDQLDLYIRSVKSSNLQSFAGLFVIWLQELLPFLPEHTGEHLKVLESYAKHRLSMTELLEYRNQNVPRVGYIPLDSDQIANKLIYTAMSPDLYGDVYECIDWWLDFVETHLNSCGFKDWQRLDQIFIKLLRRHVHESFEQKKSASCLSWLKRIIG